MLRVGDCRADRLKDDHATARLSAGDSSGNETDHGIDAWRARCPVAAFPHRTRPTLPPARAIRSSSYPPVLAPEDRRTDDRDASTARCRRKVRDGTAHRRRAPHGRGPGWYHCGIVKRVHSPGRPLAPPPIAQLDSAPGFEPGGCRFESCSADQRSYPFPRRSSRLDRRRMPIGHRTPGSDSKPPAPQQSSYTVPYEEADPVRTHIARVDAHPQTVTVTEG